MTAIVNLPEGERPLFRVHEREEEGDDPGFNVDNLPAPVPDEELPEGWARVVPLLDELPELAVEVTYWTLTGESAALVARRVGVSADRVRQLEADAFERLRLAARA